MHGQIDQLLNQDPNRPPNPPLPPIGGVRAAMRSLFTFRGRKLNEEGADTPEPPTVRKAVTQEEWDGGNLSVKLLDIDGIAIGSALDLPVKMIGNQSRPYIAASDIVDVVIYGGAQYVVVQGDSKLVGEYADGYWAPGTAVSAADNAATQEAATGQYRWYRVVELGTIHVLNGGGLDGVAIGDAIGQTRFAYKSTDTDFDGLVGGRVWETGGAKTHTHPSHTVTFPSTTGSGGGETVNVTNASPSDGAHDHSATVSGSDIAGTLNVPVSPLTVDVNVDGTTDTAVAYPATPADSLTVAGAGTVDVDFAPGGDGEHDHAMTVTTSDHQHNIGGSDVLAHAAADHKPPYYTALVLIKVA